ncbi:hypothetical protein JCGZ_19008 [Jatropha curcas]|uniref:Uncharacterized protein n=1 Tax=Jatropha curcas TaxID=180498 RepID=A0A067JYQ2_JATCU|nr:DELLA protein RGL1 [Jatropha curcas]KDP27928.1 hypothetical protein JCGZ_19008 [Jatropha curcas]
MSSTNQSSESLEVENGSGLDKCHGVEDWGESTATNSVHSDNRFNQDSLDAVQPKKEKQVQFSPTSFRLLKAYRKGLKRTSSQKIIDPAIGKPTAKETSEGLSIEEIIRIAGKRFVRTLTKPVNFASMHNHHIDVCYSGLSTEDAERVHLVGLLLKSADKVGNQQYDCANILLDECDGLSSCTGNAVERIVYYFSEALRERINRQTGRIPSQDLEKLKSFNIDEQIMAPTASLLACYRGVPFHQVAHFAGIQAIVENVAEAKKIHMIDLGIRFGDHWTCLMQALASRSECPLEQFKITAIGTTKRQLIEDTGKRLEEFSETICLPFCFKIVMVSDILDLKEDLFELDDDETVAMYSGYFIRTLIPLPDRLDSMMKVIRNLNPCIMVVIEPEVYTSSPSFVNCFIEALFYFSAYFDCLEACMGDDPNRIIIESSHFGDAIRNNVATELGERKSQCSNLNVWGRLLARFGMEETELSSSSLCQGNLVAKTFAGGNSCVLDMDGKSLLIGWKGRPMISLSSWKFISRK